MLPPPRAAAVSTRLRVQEKVEEHATRAQVVRAQAQVLRLQAVELVIHVFFISVLVALLVRQLARECLARALLLGEAGRGEVVEAEREGELLRRQLAVLG